MSRWNLICVSLAFFSLIPAASANEEFLVVADGYKSNLDSIREFVCKFTMTDCTGVTMAGVFSDKQTVVGSRVLYGTWIRKSEAERYWISNSKEFAGGSSNASVDKNIISENFLSDGRRVLRSDLGLAVAALQSQGEGDTKVIGTPVNHGGLIYGIDPWSIAQRCRQGEYTVRFDGKVDIFGVSTLAFSVGPPKEKVWLRFFVDPQKGFFPIRVDYWDNGNVGSEPNMIGYTTDFRRGSKGGWFPFRSVLVKPQGKSSNAVRYREYKVAFWDADTKVEDADLAITIPQGYQVQRQNDNWALLGTQHDRKVGVADLDGLERELAESAEHYKRLAKSANDFAPIPQAARNNRTFVIATGGIAGLIMLATVYVVWRYRSKSKKGA